MRLFEQIVAGTNALVQQTTQIYTYQRNVSSVGIYHRDIANSQRAYLYIHRGRYDINPRPRPSRPTEKSGTEIGRHSILHPTPKVRYLNLLKHTTKRPLSKGRVGLSCTVYIPRYLLGRRYEVWEWSKRGGTVLSPAHNLIIHLIPRQSSLISILSFKTPRSVLSQVSSFSLMRQVRVPRLFTNRLRTVSLPSTPLILELLVLAPLVW